MKQNLLFVAQSGGPTSVINSTLAGIIATAQKKSGIDGIYGLKHGLEGALKGEVFDLNGVTKEGLKRLANTPGAILGGSRYPVSNQDIKNAIIYLMDHNCRYFLFIGGNGTMETCLRLQRIAREKRAPLEIIGVPKTVDNDLAETDHAPGYASAARYVALAVRDQLLDLQSISTFERVRIVETMGRSVGWLAVVGEGVSNKKGASLGVQPFAGVEGEGCHALRSGAAEYLTRLVHEKLGLRSRAQVLGMNQRSFVTCVSPVDREEAYQTGVMAVKLALEGEGGNMVTLRRNGGFTGLGFVPLEQVAGVERQLPLKFYDRVNKRVTREFVEWVLPLVSDLGPQYLYQKDLPVKYPGELDNLAAVNCGGM